MKLEIKEKALEWFKQEIILQPEMGIRFFGKVYGNTQVHDGFSVGINAEKPEHTLFEKTVGGILFFAEESDEWFFKGVNMVVEFDDALNEPAYVFSEAQ